jgi:hypothetical protein
MSKALTRLVRNHPRATVVVSPDQVDALRKRLNDPRLAVRVVTWR